MKIERIINGQTIEFELTSGELFQAHKEYEKDCHREDVLDKLKSMLKEVISDTNIDDYCQNEDLEVCITDPSFDESFVRYLVNCFENNLSKNDGYYESFWETVKQTLEDELSDQHYDAEGSADTFDIIKERNDIVSILKRGEKDTEIIRIVPNEDKLYVSDLSVLLNRKNRDFLNNLLVNGSI